MKDQATDHEDVASRRAPCLLRPSKKARRCGTAMRYRVATQEEEVEDGLLGSEGNLGTCSELGHRSPSAA